MRNFMQLLLARSAMNLFVCVGLDSDAGKIPITRLGLPNRDDYLLSLQKAFRDGDEIGDEELEILATAVLIFNQRIIDATKDVVLAYKPNSAFYEALGDAGLRALRRTIKYIKRVAPGVPVILDAKRADIGNTNDGYVVSAFDWLGVDAITVHPYLGLEAMKPFLDRKDKGVIVLDCTSNEGADEFQDHDVQVDLEALAGSLPEVPGWLQALKPKVSIPFYKYVAHRVAHAWNYNGNCLLVVGATYPAKIAEVRGIVGDNVWFLIPGIGSQGGVLEETVQAGADSNGHGMIINNSRQVIFASEGPDFAEAARAVVVRMNSDVQLALAA